MFLWLIERREVVSYDETQAVVVRAKDSKAARKLADEDRGRSEKGLFLDPKWTRCRRLKEDGPEGVIIVDFFAG